MEAPKVFVSHASEDKTRFVMPFAEQLRSNGILISNDDQPSWPPVVAGPMLYMRTVIPVGVESWQ